MCQSVCDLESFLSVKSLITQIHVLVFNFAKKLKIEFTNKQQHNMYTIFTDASQDNLCFKTDSNEFTPRVMDSLACLANSQQNLPME